MKTRRFTKDRIAGVPETTAPKITPVSPLFPEGEAPDSLSARVLRTFVRPCSSVENSLRKAPGILSRELGTPVTLRATILNECQNLYGDQQKAHELYALQLIPNNRRQTAPGTLELLFEKDPATLGPDALLYLREIVPLAEDLLGSAVLYDAANLEKVTDPLTGLLNRRGIEPLYDHLIASIVREHRAPAQAKKQSDYQGVALAILDIDHFKKINDTFGHDRGDEVLKAAGKYLRNSVRRETDEVARIGGEEFLLLFEDCPKQKALELIHNFREQVKIDSAQGYFGILPSPLTFSCGIAHTSEATSYDDGLGAALWRLADKRAYRAKRAGRDRVNSTLLPLREKTYFDITDTDQ
ncbi:GGDEF domain-containing protein [Candidatus Woesearchaeota archaeon]|nr:MAG: GGDEF domain-containing protein [Candidatus Woesearchaeota archaeon]